MKFQMEETKIIKPQEIEFKDRVSVIYGYNNSGKTTFLREINQILYNQLLREFLMGDSGEISLYIPTNRVVVNDAMTTMKSLKDVEDLFHYNQDVYLDYSHHLKMLRDSLLANKVVASYIKKMVKKIFGIEVETYDEKYSDGIENVIHIFLNVIWVLTWNRELSQINEKDFTKLISKGKAYIMIDEIEMFLHVSVQVRLIQCLQEAFSECTFIFTTHSPLLLTRCQGLGVYRLQDGIVERIEDNFYYKDLDHIYEIYFAVNEIPEQIRDDLNYLGDMAWGVVVPDKKKLQEIKTKFLEQYPNIFMKYNQIIAKAEARTEEL